MTSVNVGEAREKLAEILDSAYFKKDRTIIKRRGKAVAAIVSMDDLELIEQLEDEVDNREADKRLKKLKTGDEALVPWSKVLASSGLK
jgi:prevent-host-death family protein